MVPEEKVFQVVGGPVTFPSVEATEFKTTPEGDWTRAAHYPGHLLTVHPGHLLRAASDEAEQVLAGLVVKGFLKALAPSKKQ
jgi:hypothetical protein